MGADRVPLNGHDCFGIGDIRMLLSHPPRTGTNEDMAADEEIQEDLPPYIIEHARSGRSKCKACQRKIDQGDLRLGIYVEGRFGAGHMWHHVKCAAKQSLEKVEEAYALEAWLFAKESPDPADLPSLEELKVVAEKASVEREKRTKAKKTIPYAEVAPSGRSKCKQSGELIPLGAVRIVLGMEAHFGNQVRVAPYAVLPGCVAQALEEPDIGSEAEGLAEALRENSELDSELLEAAIAEAGLE